MVEIEFRFDIEDTESTRAISDGSSADKLFYAIITEKGEVICKNSRAIRDYELEEGYVTMSVSMSNGCKYKAVFWAQNSECNAYTFNDDMSISVDYNGINNDEKRDAFYATTDLFTIDEGVVEVILRRPFAQLNAGTHTFDWKYAKDNLGFEVTKSAARISNLPDKLNLLNGEVTGDVDAFFYASALPSDKLMADVDANGKDEEYVYLSMSYLLAGNEPSTHSADFFFFDNQDRTVMFTGSQRNQIALQRNCHTDFVGQVLTDSGSLNFLNLVTTSSVYYNINEPTTISDTIYNITDYGSVQFASENGEVFTLDNIYVTGNIWTIELGEYRSPGYVNYNNVLNNVTFNNLCTTAAIECHEWYFSPACIAYGNTTLNNCSMHGATTIREPITDKHGVTHEVIPVDIGIRNESDAVFNGGDYGVVFAWTHAVVDIYNASIDTLYCGTCDSTKHSWMTIHSGTTIDSIICCEPRCPYGGKEYSTTMTIKKGATIGSIQLVSTDVEFLIIEPGAKVGKITCEGVEYTYEELRSAMGL